MIGDAEGYLLEEFKKAVPGYPDLRSLDMHTTMIELGCTKTAMASWAISARPIQTALRPASMPQK